MSKLQYAYIQDYCASLKKELGSCLYIAMERTPRYIVWKNKNKNKQGT